MVYSFLELKGTVMQKLLLTSSNIKFALVKLLLYINKAGYYWMY